MTPSKHHIFGGLLESPSWLLWFFAPKFRELGGGRVPRIIFLLVKKLNFMHFQAVGGKNLAIFPTSLALVLVPHMNKQVKLSLPNI